jgi:hypothetical protein
MPAPAALPSTVRPPAAAPGQWRAWIPKEVRQNGDVVEGHWLTFSLTPPPAETLEPVKPMPRAPKPHLGATPKKPEATQIPMVPAVPTPVLPSGLRMPQAPSLTTGGGDYGRPAAQ